MLVGIPAWRYWDLTRGEIIATFRAEAERKRLAANASMHQAWHTAALSRRKRMPSLAKLLIPKRSGEKRPKLLRQSEGDELVAQVQRDIVAASKRRAG